MDKHLFSQFDTDLDAIARKVLAMGGLVESQLARSVEGLTQFDGKIADSVMHQEHRIDEMEMEIDADLTNLIARRTPVARDLRYAMAVSKIVTNLERAGDEAERIAKRSKHIMEAAAAHVINFSEIKLAGELAGELLRDALDAFSREDSTLAAGIIQRDRALDDEFRAFVRKLISYMSEDPRSISTALDFLFVAKAIERIGDHATNIAELVVYVVEGIDVRHKKRKAQDAAAQPGMPGVPVERREGERRAAVRPSATPGMLAAPGRPVRPQDAGANAGADAGAGGDPSPG